MTTFHRICIPSMFAFFCSIAGGSITSADDSTTIANLQRTVAVAAAQQQLGYAMVADTDLCCCSDASGNRMAYATIDQQIEQLSAAIQSPAQYVEPSAAALALGAY